jgi:hypothetical protein
LNVAEIRVITTKERKKDRECKMEVKKTTQEYFLLFIL